MWRFAIIFILIVESSYGGFERTEAGSRQQAMGGALVGLSDDVWSIFYNPAGISRLSSYQIGFYYSPQQFGLSELSSSALVGAIPTGIGAIGISVRVFGFDLYKEHTFSFAYANNLEGFNFGVNINYHTVSIKNYGSAGTIGIDAGIATRLSKNIDCGASIKNINSATIGISKEKLPQSFSTGLSYKPIDSFIFSLALQKETLFDPVVNFGFEYSLVDAVTLRSGIITDPVQYCGGLGIHFLIFKMDYGFNVHNVLGFSHSISLTME